MKRRRRDDDYTNNNNTYSGSHRRSSHSSRCCNSQHVLAVVVAAANNDNDDGLEGIRRAFEEGTTSDEQLLPCSFWRSSQNKKILLGSNYPNCILEGRDFVVLCGGCPYNFQRINQDDVVDATTTNATMKDDIIIDTSSSSSSFAGRILRLAEKESLIALRDDDDGDDDRGSNDDDEAILSLLLLSKVRDSIGQYLKRIRGHFSVMLCHKTSETLLVWNDPFGFMPLFFTTATTSPRRRRHQRPSSSGVIIAFSSYWDCLLSKPNFDGGGGNGNNPALNWDVVAEYLTLGATLGGGGSNNDDNDDDKASISGSSTFCRNVRNALPGTEFLVGMSNDVGEKAVAVVQQRRYIDCFGACELLVRSDSGCEGSSNSSKDERRCNNNKSEEGVEVTRFKATKKERSPTIPGLQVESPEAQEKHNAKIRARERYATVADESSSKNHAGETGEKNDDDDDVLRDAFEAIYDAVRSILLDLGGTTVVTNAALTGGGDTRLVLSCYLSLMKNSTTNQKENQRIVFQTHAKQRTDWQIARYLARAFRLKHKRLRHVEMKGTVASTEREQEKVFSQLHDQVPLRRKQRRRSQRFREDVPAYTLQGRYGTEFLGCLCYDKTSIPVVRSRGSSTSCIQQDLEKSFAPRARKLFRVMFRRPHHHHHDKVASCDEDDDLGGGGSGRVGGVVHPRDPVDTLREILHGLEQEKLDFERLDTTSTKKVSFDVAYAFQLQLFTRSFLCDIYGGLRGGSWFAMPYADFTRNAVSPFLDSRLLRIMLCRVSSLEKEEPYEFYGKLYRRFVSPPLLLRVPCNNKLLCRHTGMPRALKAQEVLSRPFLADMLVDHRPKRTMGGFCRGLGAEDDDASLKAVMTGLKDIFTPLFWDAFVSIAKSSSSVKVHAEDIASDMRPEVQALVREIGVYDAGVLSARLVSFLLWYERRFLPHCKID